MEMYDMYIEKLIQRIWRSALTRVSIKASCNQRYLTGTLKDIGIPTNGGEEGMHIPGMGENLKYGTKAEDGVIRGTDSCNAK